jgi:hypothetical protein
MNIRQFATVITRGLALEEIKSAIEQLDDRELADLRIWLGQYIKQPNLKSKRIG